MDLLEFRLLPENQKCQLIEKKGVYITGRNDGPMAYNLYGIFSFYVELCFDFNKSYLDKVTIISDTIFLEPYLQEIELIM